MNLCRLLTTRDSLFVDRLYNVCFEGCATAASECSGCLGGADESGLPLLFVMALIVLGLFTVNGIFYSVLVATMVGRRIWQRQYHILAKRMLTKEYLVEGESTGTDWSSPPLPATGACSAAEIPLPSLNLEIVQCCRLGMVLT